MVRTISGRNANTVRTISVGNHNENINTLRTISARNIKSVRTISLRNTKTVETISARNIKTVGTILVRNINKTVRTISVRKYQQNSKNDFSTKCHNSKILPSRIHRV
jgi:hypothetical protein